MYYVDIDDGDTKNDVKETMSSKIYLNFEAFKYFSLNILMICLELYSIVIYITLVIACHKHISEVWWGACQMSIHLVTDTYHMKRANILLNELVK